MGRPDSHDHTDKPMKSSDSRELSCPVKSKGAHVIPVAIGVSGIPLRWHVTFIAPQSLRWDSRAYARWPDRDKEGDQAIRGEYGKSPGAGVRYFFADTRSARAFATS